MTSVLSDQIAALQRDLAQLRKELRLREERAEVRARTLGELLRTTIGAATHVGRKLDTFRHALRDATHHVRPGGPHVETHDDPLT